MVKMINLLQSAKKLPKIITSVDSWETECNKTLKNN